MPTSNPLVSDALVKTGAFKDKNPPVILTSGEALTPFFINSENLLQDDGDWKKYGDDPAAMVRHSYAIASKPDPLRTTIEELARHVQPLFPIALQGERKFAVSGGQRRDWIFSGPVAVMLSDIGLGEIYHIALFKQEPGQEDKVQIYDPSGQLVSYGNLKNFYVVQLSDMLTKGSSSYRIEHEKKLGWIEMLRAKGAEVHHVVSVVDRQEGAEANLRKVDIDTSSLVYIDQAFLRAHSNFPERAIEYSHGPDGPRKFTEAYLRDEGISALVYAFDPAGESLDKARRFMAAYQGYLMETGGYKALDKAVKGRYGKDLTAILGPDQKPAETHIYLVTQDVPNKS